MRVRRLGAVLAALALLACAGAPKPARRIEPAGAAPAPADPTGAVWRYHPRAPARMLARAELGAGLWLLAGRRGERWVFDGERGALQAAVPAEEDLVAILSASGDERWFVGRSGTTYRAPTPLAPFVDAQSPFEPLARVSGAGGVVLGVGRDRKLVRSGDAGRTWAAVGPAGVSFVDVAIDTAGHALALATPEALFHSGDAGLTFRPLAVPVGGTLSLSLDPIEGFLRVRGVLGSRRWVPGEPGRLEPDIAGERDALPKGARPPLGPDAGALVEGRAALTRASYLEARLVDESARRYELVRGTLGGAFETRPLPELQGCRSVRVAAFERTAYFACFRAGPASSQPVELSTSRDFGSSVSRTDPLLHARLAEFRMALGALDTLLFTGVCAPSSQGPGCAPNGILYRRPAPTPVARSRPARGERPRAKAAFELGVAAAPSLVESALDLAFDAHGSTAFAVGATSKAIGAAVFVSSDQGKSFELSELGEASAETGIPETRGGMLSAADDGTMALVLGPRRGAPSLIVLDAQGHVLRSGAPSERALLGAAGLSALAIGLESGTVWESLDGGASWAASGRAPLDLCPGDSNCDVPVRCSSAGCVVGDELSRIGWGGSEEPELDTPASFASGTDGGYERRLRTPIACTLAATPWIALPGARELPTASEAALGDTAWFALAEDPLTASATVYQARGGVRPRVDAVPLLKPVTRASEYAFVAIPQIEGAAAVRYRVPDTKTTESRPGQVEPRLTQVEVAWNNLFEGRVQQVRLADGGPYAPGDFERGEAAAQLARPDLVSIAERGLYLRLHARGRDRQPTLFLDGSSIVTLPPIPWPEQVPRGGHTEMARLGAAHIGLALLSPGGALVRARFDAGKWIFDAASVGLPDPEAFGMAEDIDITYFGGQAALHVELLELAGKSAEAHVFPLRADGAATGPALRVPTQLDLATRPAACTPDVRRTTSRLVAHAYFGTRHPVVITDAVEPPRSMLTGGAVLHGTAAEPCAAAFELVPVAAGTPEPGTLERGVVLLDDLEHAFLTRRAREPGSERARVEYRVMSCRFDPNLELPEEMRNAPEALAPKRGN